jgi:c-di-GMP-binding flagellar brake protein YcgR
MEEKRRFPRLEIAFGVRWVGIFPDTRLGKVDESDLTRNISEGGICLIVEDKLAVGDRLQLKISLSAEKEVNAVGWIVWLDSFEVSSEKDKKRYRVGIKFLKISSKYREEIKGVVLSSRN